MPLEETLAVEKNPQELNRRTPEKNRLLFRLYVTPRNGASARALCQPEKKSAGNISTTIMRSKSSIPRKHPRRAKKRRRDSHPYFDKRSPAPIWTIVGDLSEEAVILAAMKRNGTARRRR